MRLFVLTNKNGSFNLWEMVQYHHQRHHHQQQHHDHHRHHHHQFIDFLSRRNVADAVRDFLIIEGPTPAGILADLVALNIQRGRDHGLPGYIEYSKLCDGPLAKGKDFNALTDIPRIQRIRLEGTYRVVEDIDPFPGMMSENLQPGSQLGRTTTCIMLQQFADIRRADRFWYERNDPCTGFTAAQLAEIRKVKLSRVICDNTDDVKRIQPKVFRRRTFNGGDNDLTDCCDLPFLNLNVFKEGGHFALSFCYFHSDILVTSELPLTSIVEKISKNYKWP